MKSLIKVLFVVLTVAFVATILFNSYFEKGFTITSRGQAKAQIVTGKKPPETVVFAAKELQKFVKKMSGAELPIVAKAVPDTPAILLGPAAREKIPAADLKGIKRDGYIITVTNGNLCIVGIDDSGPHTDIEGLLEKGITHNVPLWNFNRGTLYGVYRLLEELGMRWFLPGDFGERTPDIKSLAFNGDIRENPHFISRAVGYWSLGHGGYNKNRRKITIMPREHHAIGFTPADNRMWELRMRGATFQIPLNHYPTSTRWVERFGKTHPEYFALLAGGARDNIDPHGGHLCYTCPGVVNESVADIKAYAEGKECEARGISRIHPITKRTTNNDNRGWRNHIALGEYFSLLPHDGFRACTCPECKKLISTSGIRGETHSELVWTYVAKCAERIPDLKMTCLAYGTYSLPYPGMKKLPPNVTVGYCGFSHPASLYYKNKFDQYEKSVSQWAELSHGNMAFWQHYLASNRNESNVGMPEHTPEMYAKVIQVMVKNGNHVFCEQITDSIMFEVFNRYMLLKMFYNPKLDEKEIFNDYITRFYGPNAGPIIGKIYEDIGKKCVERYSNNYAGYSFWEKLFNEKTMSEYHAKVNLALKKAAGTKYEKAVSVFKKYYLGLMEKGRLRYSEPLALLLESFNPQFISRPVKTKKPINIDGKLDERAWKAASTVTISNNVKGKAIQYQTMVKTCHDTQNIYFAVSAVDPAPKTRTVKSGDPGEVDGIEIYMDVPHNHKGYYRVGIDLTGKVYDYHYIDKIELGDQDWRSKAVTSVELGKSNYVMEVAIPRSSLTAPTGSLSYMDWGILVGRTETKAPQSNDRQSSTSRLLRNNFNQANYFNNMRFTDR